MQGEGDDASDDAFYGDLSSTSFGVSPAEKQVRSTEGKPGLHRGQGAGVQGDAKRIRSFVSPTLREDQAMLREKSGRKRAVGTASYRPDADSDSGAFGSVDFARTDDKGPQQKSLHRGGTAPRPERVSVAPPSNQEKGGETDQGAGGGGKKKWVWKPVSTNPRDVAFQVLMKRETKGTTAFIEELLQESLSASALSPSDRGLCKELVLGCVRWRGMLDQLVALKQKGGEGKKKMKKQLPEVSSTPPHTGSCNHRGSLVLPSLQIGLMMTLGRPCVCCRVHQLRSP